MEDIKKQVINDFTNIIDARRAEAKEALSKSYLIKGVADEMAKLGFKNQAKDLMTMAYFKYFSNPLIDEGEILDEFGKHFDASKS